MAVGVVSYPGSLDTADTLIRVVNKPATGWPTLTFAIGASDLSLTVTDGSKLAASGALVIENEVLYYDSIAGNVVTVASGGRGKESTTAASHAAGVSVRQAITARHHSVLVDAILAVEAAINSGGTFTGDITIQKTNPALTLDDSSGTGTALVSLKDNGTTRWQVGKLANDDFAVSNPVTGNTPIQVADTDDAITLGKTGGLTTVRDNLAIGAAPALSGKVRLENLGAIIARNAANSADIEIVELNASNQIVLNEPGAAVVTRIEGDTDANLVYVDGVNDRVGFGYSAPAGKVDVATTAGFNILESRFSADAFGPWQNFRKSRNATIGSHTIVQSGDVLGQVYFSGSNGTGYDDAAAIAAVVDGTPGASNDMPGRLDFYTTPDGSNTLGLAVRIDNAKNVLGKAAIRSDSATAGVGYATGAGGTVTQLTSKSTTVVLNKVTGQITMNAAALAGDTTVSFTLTNSAIAATDVVAIWHVSGGTVGSYTVTVTPGSGTATVVVRNITTGSLSEAIVLAFAVIKAVTA